MAYPEDMTRNIIKHTMKKFVTAKGKEYYLYLKVLNKHMGDELVSAVDTMRENSDSGLLSYADLCHLLVSFEFPANRMASMISILEKRRAILTGRTDAYIKKFGVAASLKELGYEKCPNPDCWRWYADYCTCDEAVREV